MLLLSAFLMVGCARQSEGMSEELKINWGHLVPPSGESYYFRHKAYRVDEIFISDKNGDFLRHNIDRASLIARSVEVVEGSGWDYSRSAGSGRRRPKIDFGWRYDFYRFDIGVKGTTVEAMVNEEQGFWLIIVTIMSDASGE
jgi:hypothetical protein